jgi:hypothetical protein
VTRRTPLIAEFSGSDGYAGRPCATGWAWLVSDAFRPALGIEWAERIVDGARTSMWVQTGNYDFREGDVIYRRDSKSSENSLQISRAEAASAKHEKPGWVEFTLHPSGERRTLSQADFIRFLRDG